MFFREMVASNDGNISVKLSDGTFLCTPSGYSKGYMTPDMMCHIDSEGAVLEDNGYKPSSEMKMHLKVYELCPDANAVVHAHPIYATTYACLRKKPDVRVMAEAVVSLKDIPVCDYATPSTNEVPDSIIPYISEYEAVLLANHGALTRGKNLLSAYNTMESVEFVCQINYTASALGGASLLTDRDVDKLMTVRRKVWGKA